MSILLIGATGYVGSAFAKELDARSASWKAITHGSAVEVVRWMNNVDLVVNCAAYIPHESVSLCDQNKNETIKGNVLLPALLAHACNERSIPIAHVCTGCIWSDGQEHEEDDPPQRAFTGHCGFYVGTKLVGSDEVRKNPKHYIWRVRLPFDEFDSPRNYLSKLSKFTEVWDHDNSLSHRGDFAKACLDLWEMRCPWGTYNVMNHGTIHAASVCGMLQDHGIRKDFPNIVAGAQGGSKVSIRKLLATGVKMRSVTEAIEESLTNWKPNVQA